jgi:hypothetical protein
LAQRRDERVFDVSLQYRPLDPVRVRVTRRDDRVTVTDDGAAVARAGRPPGWHEVADRVSDEMVVNVSRSGAVSLPVVRVGPGEAEIVRRIAEASLALYQDLLEITDAVG